MGRGGRMGARRHIKDSGEKLMHPREGTVHEELD